MSRIFIVRDERFVSAVVIRGIQMAYESLPRVLANIYPKDDHYVSRDKMFEPFGDNEPIEEWIGSVKFVVEWNELAVEPITVRVKSEFTGILPVGFGYWFTDYDPQTNPTPAYPSQNEGNINLEFIAHNPPELRSLKTKLLSLLAMPQFHIYLEDHGISINPRLNPTPMFPEDIEAPTFRYFGDTITLNFRAEWVVGSAYDGEDAEYLYEAYVNGVLVSANRSGTVEEPL